MYLLLCITLMLTLRIKEFDHCYFSTGRIQFYDQYGVIRDVLQNHLTEVMTLMLMNLPANLSNSAETLQNKLYFLASLQHIDKINAVVGQYQAYNGEVQEELNKTKDYYSVTPTFTGEQIIFIHVF